MKRLSVQFDAPYTVTVAEEDLPALAPDQVMVRSVISAISSGTELLFYRGQVPPDMDVDAAIGGLTYQMRYPIRYGYAVAGRVIATGAQIDPAWMGRMVFAFHPHASHFAARPDDLIPAPHDLSEEDAVFLPNMETAVNLIMDGQPMLGEQVVVLGQGVVGLLTTATLAQFPLRCLAVLDRYPLRREKARQLGARVCLDPAAGAEDGWRDLMPNGADLAYELTGSPDALNAAIDMTGYSGRIVIGSWYGQKRGEIHLGGRFHRSRIRLISSQVSTIAPEWTGRWDKARRFEVAWDMIRRVRPRGLITHRIPVAEAAQAYALLDRQPESAVQVIFTYPE